MRKITPGIRSLLALALTLTIAAIPSTLALAQSGEPPAPTVHIVQQGETLFSIATRYGLTVDRLAHANGIPDPRQIYIGQRLTIPANGDLDAVETTTYLVQAGDTLYSLARRYQTTWQVLARLNNLLSPDTLYAGQVIRVPSAPLSADLARGASYIVGPDDTLFRIALRYDIPPWTLTTISGLADPLLLHQGQELVIPDAGNGLLPVPFVNIAVQPLPVSQGNTLIIAVHTTEPVTLTGRLFERGIPFAEEDGVYYSLVGVHVFTEPGLYELELTATDQRGHTTTVDTGVVVQSGDFEYQQIDLPANRAGLLSPAAIARDKERLDAVRYLFTPERRWTVPFQRPCAGPVSAYFGAHRSYNGGPYTSYHSGTDFRASTGTPVYAPADGIVVLAEPLALWGNGLVIDHGWGVLTGYGHLSSIEVAVGQHVTRGQLIARVGNTGLSTGSHLHWEMWVGSVSVNGLQWLEGDYPWIESDWLAVGG